MTNIARLPPSKRRRGFPENRPLLVHHVQGIELIIIVLIEPGADEIVEPKAGTARQRQGIDHELRDGSLGLGIRFIVDDMDGAVSDLKKIDAPSWLWKSVVELSAMHESAYLEHCRRFALSSR